jgi:hypothetical protein
MHCCIWNTPNGKMAVTTIADGLDESHVMAKTVFEVGKLESMARVKARWTGTEPDLEVELGRIRLLHFDPALNVPIPSYSSVDDQILPDWARRNASSKQRHENFRDAAEWDGSNVVINMPKARLIQLDRIARAVASQGVPAHVENLDGAATVEELRASWPAGLAE